MVGVGGAGASAAVSMGMGAASSVGVVDGVAEVGAAVTTGTLTAGAQPAAASASSAVPIRYAGARDRVWDTSLSSSVRAGPTTVVESARVVA